MERTNFQAMGALQIWFSKLVVDPKLRPGDGLGSHREVMLGGSSHDLDTWLITMVIVFVP